VGLHPHDSVVAHNAGLDSGGPLTIASTSVEFGNLRRGMGLLNPRQDGHRPKRWWQRVAHD